MYPTELPDSLLRGQPQGHFTQVSLPGGTSPLCVLEVVWFPQGGAPNKEGFCRMFAASHRQCFRALIAKVAVRNQFKTTCICDDYLVLQRPSFYLSHLNLSIRPKGESQIFMFNYTFASFSVVFRFPFLF